MINKKKATNILCGFLVCYLIDSFMFDRADDLVLMRGIETHGSIIEWGKWFANNWGGRIIPVGLEVVLLQLPKEIFNIFNAACQTLLIYYSTIIFGSEEKKEKAIWSISIIILVALVVPFDILYGTVFWKSAAVVYVWGLAAFFVAIKPLVYEMQNKWFTKGDVVCSIIAIIYTSGFELIGALLVGFSVLFYLYIIIQKKKVKATTHIIAAIIVCLTLFFLSFPGNKARAIEELMCWYPSFDMYSICDRILIGLHYTIKKMEEEILIVELIISLLLALKNWKKRNNRLMKVISLYVSLYMVLCCIAHLGPQISDGRDNRLLEFFNTIQIDAVSQFNIPIIDISRDVLHYMTYVLLGCLIIYDEKKIDVLNFLLYFGGLATIVVMGLSPTVYVSGGRTRFICYYFFVVLTMRLLEKEIIDNKQNIHI